VAWVVVGADVGLVSAAAGTMGPSTDKLTPNRPIAMIRLRHDRAEGLEHRLYARWATMSSSPGRNAPRLVSLAPRPPKPSRTIDRNGANLEPALGKIWGFRASGRVDGSHARRAPPWDRMGRPQGATLAAADRRGTRVKYYVNKNAQENGEHEVHSSSCSLLPVEADRIYLGDFTTCTHGVAAAKQFYPHPNGCSQCSNECHTG
jgi:hypothetical protein